MTANYDGENIEFKEVLPLLPIRELVVYPFMILPLFVGRESSIKAVEQSLEHYDRLIFLASQKDISAEVPGPNDIYQMGTVAMIMRMRKLPDGRIKILIQGLTKARIIEYQKNNNHFQVKLEKVETGKSNIDQIAKEALMRTAREHLEQIINRGKVLSPDILMVLEDIQDPGRMADLISSNLNLKVSDGQLVLETHDPLERLQLVNQILIRELDVLTLQTKIKSAAKDEISKSQKEYFLREQIKAIKSELGDDPNKTDDFQDLRSKITEGRMPKEAELEAGKQLARLEKMHPESSEASILRSYLECLVDLPWSKTSDDKLDLKLAKEILDDDHFDLQNVKERILEYLAVKILKKEQGENTIKGPILCFMGPPGVGKTSLGKSIAKAMGREFVRISLGGVKDEAEIRGHRRTYVGAMPGRFIQALQQAGTNNPVIMLDEVDKLGSDFRGDPSSALLEVLDPEQNHAFRDHYLNIPFNLSNTMFIATANTLENIPGPLRDRMEILNLTGYTQEEKVAICKRFLIPKQMKENGISESNIEFTDEAINAVIRNFTSEAGLRNLERQVGSLCRKVARRIAGGDQSKTHIFHKTVEDMLGPPIYHIESEFNYHDPGVAIGLAWTPHGGELMQVEVTRMKGKGITLTGRLGEIMQESAKTAIGYIRSNAKKLNINEDIFEKEELHIHVPSGATPKDGPSAGITLATAIISLLTSRKIRNNLAMTGEITLKGKVLAVGGVKEKALAALRAGLKTIIIPSKNQKDLVEIPDEFKDKINFIPVNDIAEVLQIALETATFEEDEEKLETETEMEKIPKKKKEKKTSPPPMAA